jgi:ribosomal protein L34E
MQSVCFDSWHVIDYQKYRTYLELRKERDKFLKSLHEMRNCDWVIEKKLLDAGGLGKTVYIYPARGGGRNTSIERYLELIESGRDVKIMRASDICKKPNRSYGPYDSDLWDHLDSVVTQKLYEELCHQELQKDIERLFRNELETPKIKTLDDDVHNHRLFNDWYIYGNRINDGFITITETD